MIALISIATGKYESYIPTLHHSFRRNFKPSLPADLIMLTNSTSFKDKQNLIIKPVEHTNWPYSTLLRFHFFNRYADLLSKYEYIYFIDCDMIFNQLVGDEILPGDQEDLVGTIHPGFYTNPSLGTFETNEKSTAFTKLENRKTYYQACFFGGKSEHFLKMSSELQSNIDKDLESDLIALWHDESHLNSYYSDKNIKQLSPSYAYPQTWDIPFEKKIIHLAKNHTEIRN